MEGGRLPAVTGATMENGPAAEHQVSAPVAIPPQVERDEQLLALWLFDRPEETRRAYAGDVRGFLAHTGKPIQAITLGDVQGFIANLAGLAPASRGRKLSAVKSLFGFAHRLGYVGTVQKLGDGDGNGMTCHAEAGWESVDGVGAAAGRDGR